MQPHGMHVFGTGNGRVKELSSERCLCPRRMASGSGNLRSTALRNTAWTVTSLETVRGRWPA
eukprot:3412824-Alexandrium_andersonii.AAC.1